jgi:hypothetical protein
MTNAEQHQLRSGTAAIRPRRLDSDPLAIDGRDDVRPLSAEGENLVAGLNGGVDSFKKIVIELDHGGPSDQ